MFLWAPFIRESGCACIDCVRARDSGCCQKSHSAGGEFTIQLLHFADVDGNESTALNNVDEFSALVNGFQTDPIFGPVTITVSSGDNIIPGPRWFAAENSAVRSISGSNEPGHADHFMMNAFGVMASAVGNHELDQGPGEFAGSINPEAGGGAMFPGTRFPYLAANIDFSSEEDLNIGTDGADYRLLLGLPAVRGAGRPALLREQRLLRRRFRVRPLPGPLRAPPTAR